MEHKFKNIEQSAYWNEKSGPKWVKLDDYLNERFSILTDELFNIELQSKKVIAF